MAFCDNYSGLKQIIENEYDDRVATSLSDENLYDQFLRTHSVQNKMAALRNQLTVILETD